MRKKLLSFIIALVFFIASGSAQTIADFENLSIDSTGFWNGSDLSGGFADGNAYFFNEFNADWGSWSGWAFTNLVDTVTSGWGNQYSAKTGGGVEASANYAVFYSQGQISLIGDAAKGGVEGFYITNSTYAYNSMRDGDAYSKKFGGETGNDPDFFKLTIQKYLDGTLSNETVEVYLADFRFEDNDQDYILKEWQWVDLTSLGNIDSLKFSLSSSDNGEFGMNTPAYFCIDNLTTVDGTVGFEKLRAFDNVIMTPNPVHDFLRIEIGDSRSDPIVIQVYDLLGRKLIQRKVSDSDVLLDLQYLESQQYIVNGMSESDGRLLFSKMIMKL